MLSGKQMTIGLAMLFVLCTILGALYAGMQFAHQRMQGTLQEVTEEALYDARYDNARMTNKVFVVDKSVFSRDLDNSNIKSLSSNPTIKIEYMHDTSSAATKLSLPTNNIPIVAVRVTVVDQKNSNLNKTVTYVINSQSKNRTDDVSD